MTKLICIRGIHESKYGRHLHTGKKVMGHVQNQGQKHKDRTEDEEDACGHRVQV